MRRNGAGSGAGTARRNGAGGRGTALHGERQRGAAGQGVAEQGATGNGRRGRQAAAASVSSTGSKSINEVETKKTASVRGAARVLFCLDSRGPAGVAGAAGYGRLLFLHRVAWTALTGLAPRQGRGAGGAAAAVQLVFK